jgi:four helix bundle protein
MNRESLLVNRKGRNKTAKIESRGDTRGKEQAPPHGSNRADSTLNAQRSTPNAQRRQKKTPKTEERTPIIEWIADCRVEEEAPHYAVERGGSTPNARKGEPRFDLEDRFLKFSARIIRLVDALPNTRAANHVAGQLLRCGTSPYGNHGEVEAAESRKDFVHKLKVCLKELKETRRWLRLIAKSALLPVPKMAPILSETEELIKIFFSSIRTAERNAE